ncbi:uncharacterized protein PHALS_07500 [Plasmopara halstedii]|uniref:Uncharacterized protein n=1 Tax=Plasmopara halstedii TaxID=4781 RepID=A0A0P1B655_PLAHL|nr:uncharacterized protein PHALS_07500 [Plasmopara halstedii]CEG49753.1 hypothetical protein PHALS_07500 [Plasmopara halstedii]|eukprot:XP_024586122.1 hypothetical protein PHALS_07500 [Plasmopara halstedii]
MSFSTLHLQTNRIYSRKRSVQSVENYNDSCPLLEADERHISHLQSEHIQDVRHIDDGVLYAKKSFIKRIQSHKNRLMQRFLVACRLADPPRDQLFNKTQASNRLEMKQLLRIRNSLHNHSQSVVDLSETLLSNSTHVSKDYDLGVNIQNSSLAFRDQAAKEILEKINYRIAELKRIDLLIEDRAKLVLDIEYAKRALLLEHQRGNVTRIAERRQALEAAQCHCEQSTRFISDQLKCMRLIRDTEVLGLFQEYALLVVKFFEGVNR